MFQARDRARARSRGFPEWTGYFSRRVALLDGPHCRHPGPVPTARLAPDRSRGYAIALVSALVFSTTAIFIRHLTGRYGLAAGVLSFWRSALLVAFLASILVGIRPRMLRARRADSRLPRRPRAGAGALQPALDHLGGPMRRQPRHRPRLHLGRLHRPARVPAPARAARALGCGRHGAVPGRVHARIRRARGWARTRGRDRRDHGPGLRRPVRALHGDGAGRRPPRHRSLDHGPVRLRGQRSRPARLPAPRAAARPGGARGGRPPPPRLERLRLGGAPRPRGRPDAARVRALQRLAAPPAQRRGQPGAHARAGAHRRHRLPAPGRADDAGGAPGERGDPRGRGAAAPEGAGGAPVTAGAPPAAPPPGPARPRSCRRRSGRRGGGDRARRGSSSPGTQASPCSTTSQCAKPTSSRSERAE